MRLAPGRAACPYGLCILTAAPCSFRYIMGSASSSDAGERTNMKRYIIPILACLALGVPAPLTAQDLTITNARIIGPNGAVIERGSIVVRAGKIVSVTPGAPPTTSGKTIDAKGM